MRCRRFSHYYTMFVTKKGIHPLLENWGIEKAQMAVAYTRWSPPTDIYETESKIYIMAELAGVKLEDIDIALYENALVVEGQRKFSPGSQNGVYHTAEIRQGPFCLEILLTHSIDPDQIHAQYEEGLLNIVLVKQKGD